MALDLMAILMTAVAECPALVNGSKVRMLSLLHLQLLQAGVLIGVRCWCHGQWCGSLRRCIAVFFQYAARSFVPSLASWTC